MDLRSDNNAIFVSSTYLFFYIETVELSGVDDGVDGSDVEDSDVDDEGVDGDEFFRY